MKNIFIYRNNYWLFDKIIKKIKILCKNNYIISEIDINSIEDININQTKNNILLVGQPENNKIFIEKYVKLAKLIKNNYIIIVEPYFYHRQINDRIVPYFNHIITQQYDLMNMKDNEKKIIWIPEYHYLFDKFDENKKYDFILDTISKKKYLLSNNPISSSVSEFREKIIIDFLCKDIKIDIYGKNNILKIASGNKYKGILGENFTKGNFGNLSKIKTNILKDYKFIIVCENIFENGIFTEKFIDSLNYLSLPIYFGSNNPEYFIPELFKDAIINGLEFNNTQEIIDFINNMTDDEYNRRLNNIKKYRNKYYKFFSMDNICEYLSNLFYKTIDLNHTYENDIKIFNDNKIILSKDFTYNLHYFTCYNCKKKFKTRKSFVKHFWNSNCVNT